MMTVGSVEHLLIGKLVSALRWPLPLTIEWPLDIIPRRPLPRPLTPLLLSFDPLTLATACALLVLLNSHCLIQTIAIVRSTPLSEVLHRPLLISSGPEIASVG